jgi:hypothetical protein
MCRRQHGTPCRVIEPGNTGLAGRFRPFFVDHRVEIGDDIVENTQDRYTCKGDVKIRPMGYSEGEFRSCGRERVEKIGG